ncbi:Der1-like family-domain-containing protein [Mortierella sp. GBAus27b]|nr:Der1-like family-domain-containing protein [Mortierella sp. GBAus27b]
MAENELLAAYKSIPVVTRTLLTATILLSVGIAVRLVSPYTVVLNWDLILYRFHLHRIFAPFFISTLGFNFLFDLYFLFTYGSQLESSTFSGRSADFAWFIIFTSIVSAIVGPYLGVYYLFQSLLLSIIHLWSQSNSERIVSFMFGFQFKALYFPWVLIAYTYILGGASIPWSMLLGVASAHLYYFLDSVYPAMGGPRLIPTPRVLYMLLPSQDIAGARFTGNGTTANVYRAAPTAPAAGTTGHQWGRGQRLG